MKEIMEKETYVRQFIAYDHDMLRQLDEEHRGRNDVQPFVEAETAKLTALLVRSHRFRAVLELGTGLGYSALWLGKAVQDTGGTLVTVDNHERTNREARRNIEAAGLGKYVQCVEADIETYLPQLLDDDGEEQFDLIFQDSGKYLYPLVYEQVFQLLRPGGILVSDDVAFPAAAAGVRNSLKRHIELYNAVLFSDDRYYSTMLPAGHGAAVSLKLPGRQSGIS
jgi:predicted O-methyltransferase YrrM